MAPIKKSKEEIATLREGGKRLAAILQEIVGATVPGISSRVLDERAEELIRQKGGAPAFKGYRIKEAKTPYPASLCVSINDEVVHAIPRGDRLIREGDIVGLDIGMRWPGPSGLFTDTAVTIGIGNISSKARRLLSGTAEALEVGITKVRPGATTGDIGNAVQKFLEMRKLGIIRDLAGHGVGYALHEEPLIPNYGTPGAGTELFEGMVIALEPMATLGTWNIVLGDDEWTFRTADGSLAAHFEHTVVVTVNGAEVLTRMQFSAAML